MTVPEIRAADPPEADDDTQPAPVEPPALHAYIVVIMTTRPIEDGAQVEWRSSVGGTVTLDAATAEAEVLAANEEHLTADGWSVLSVSSLEIPSDWLLAAVAAIHPARVTLEPA